MLIELATCNPLLLFLIMSMISNPMEAISSWYERVSKKNIYRFNEGSLVDHDILSVKGANLCEMLRMGIEVPPGFIISAEYTRDNFNGSDIDDTLFLDICCAINQLEHDIGRKFGDVENPLLVSIRAGSPFSPSDITCDSSLDDELEIIGFLGSPESWCIPGLQQTVLSLGLNDNIVEKLSVMHSRRFALNIYAHFILRFGNSVYDVPTSSYYNIIASVIKRTGRNGSALTSDDLMIIIREFKQLQSIPDDPFQQLRLLICSMYKTWFQAKNLSFRFEVLNVSKSTGMAIIVQTMEFGSSGFCISRNPVSGEKSIVGEFWPSSGLKCSFDELAVLDPIRSDELKEILSRLETHFRDMQTVEYCLTNDGRITILQCKPSRRTVCCCLKVAIDMVHENLLTEREALLRIDPKKLSLYTSLINFTNDDSAEGSAVFSSGTCSSHGCSAGVLALTQQQCIEYSLEHPVIFFAGSLQAVDSSIIQSASAIIALDGTIMADISVLCRSIGKPCIICAQDMYVETSEDGCPLRLVSEVCGAMLYPGDKCMLNAISGEFFCGWKKIDLPDIESCLEVIMNWSNKYRKIRILAQVSSRRDEQSMNDNCEDVDGVFLKTGWMFRSSEDRLLLTRSIILEASLNQSGSYGDLLTELQRDDFRKIFRKSQPRPVFVKLLDEPLHEFLQFSDRDLDSTAVELNVKRRAIGELVRYWCDANPSMGLIGSRISSVLPLISEIQVKASLLAVNDLLKEGLNFDIVFLIPWACSSREVSDISQFIQNIYLSIMENSLLENSSLKAWANSVGVVISTPRLCLRIDTIVPDASFVVFNSHDITQQAFGMSEQDMIKYLPKYLRSGILFANPFKSLDDKGVGELLRIGLERAHARTGQLIQCYLEGEHCWDPRYA